MVCAIIEKDGKILVAKRRISQSQGGFWEFPGGKINGQETPEQAVIREIREELGIEILVEKKLDPVSYSYPGKEVLLIPFIAGIISGTPFPHEHDAIDWITRAGSDELNWLPPDIEIAASYWKEKAYAVI